MTAAGRITEIVVAGGGITGLSAAALLKRRIPGANVVIVGGPPADALSERIGTTLPSVVGFHGDMALDEANVLSTGASFRLGTMFDGWNAGLPSYVHAYGEVGRPFGSTSFYLHWVRAAKLGRVEPFETYSPAAMLARGNRFVHPQSGTDSPLSSFEYGLNLDPVRYSELLRAYCRHLGVIELPGAVADVRLDGETGFVDALLLDDGSSVAGHLFVDCTGAAARVRSRLDDRFEDWSQWLPCDRVLVAEAQPTVEPRVLDRAVAHSAGWRWESSSRALAQHGLVYASGHLSDSKAERVLRGSSTIEASAEPIAFRSGRRSQPWLRNCVAVGDAAVTIDPLEWTGLHLAHSALDRLISKMSDRDCSPVELWDYNREAAAEAERARDFVALHYCTADRPKDDFWRAAAAVEPPASLNHTLSLWRERGRLPIYEEETFTRHSWAAVLLGQGVLPRRVDPLIDIFAPEQSDRAMAQIRETVASMVPQLPTQGAYLRQIQAARPR